MFIIAVRPKFPCRPSKLRYLIYQKRRPCRFLPNHSIFYIWYLLLCIKAIRAYLGYCVILSNYGRFTPGYFVFTSFNNFWRKKTPIIWQILVSDANIKYLYFWSLSNSSKLICLFQSTLFYAIFLLQNWYTSLKHGIHLQFHLCYKDNKNVDVCQSFSRADILWHVWTLDAGYQITLSSPVPGPIFSMRCWAAWDCDVISTVDKHCLLQK
jgi:hypothetical protein